MKHILHKIFHVQKTYINNRKIKFIHIFGFRIKYTPAEKYQVYSDALISAIDKYNADDGANILIEELGDTDISTVYFSSNALYHPMSLCNFNLKIRKQNKFEWYKCRYKYANKHIFVRDLRYLWYQKGINNKYDTVAKTAELLQSKVGKGSLLCVGGSAGGYAAILFGLLLNAKMIIVSDAQIDFKLMLKEQYEKGSFARHYAHPIFQELMETPCEYAHLVNLIKERQNTKIYFIHSKNSWVDKSQYELVKDCPNIKFLFAESAGHGDFGSAILHDVMQLTEPELDLLFSNQTFSSPKDVQTYIQKIKKD